MAGNTDICFICDKALKKDEEASKIVTLQKVAIARLRAASLKRKDKKYIKWKNMTLLDVHRTCYHTYINNNSIAAAKKRSLIIQTQNFDFKTNCFFCGGPADEEYIAKMKKYGPKNRNVVRLVSRVQTKENVLKFIKQHSENNDFMKTVKDRIKLVDLIAVNGRYHNHCMSRFYKYEPSSGVIGRPIIGTTMEILDFITNYISENPKECQYSLKELLKKYQNINEDEDKPNLCNIKNRLIQFFGDEMRIYANKSDYHIIRLDSIDDVLRKAFDCKYCQSRCRSDNCENTENENV